MKETNLGLKMSLWPLIATSAAQTRLAEAESSLAEAKKQLADQEAIRSGDERNYARVLERLKPFQEAVQNAEKEVEQREGASATTLHHPDRAAGATRAPTNPAGHEMSTPEN